MNGTKTYWLVFTNGDSEVHKLMKSGFGHVFLLMRDEYNWMLIDPRAKCLDVDILPNDIRDNVPKLFKDNGNRVLEIEAKVVKKNKPRLLNYLIPRYVTCTSVIKYVLGIKLMGITPYSLYRRLCKMKHNGFYKGGVVRVNFII